MAFEKKRNIAHFAIFGITLFVFYIIQYGGFMPASRGFTPINLLVPTVIIAGVFLGEWAGAMFGLICGVFMDAVSSDVPCFNTVALMVLGCAAGLMINYMLNNTAISALMLCFGAMLIYETARFFFAHIINGFEGTAPHYFRVSVFSILITTLISLPLYFLIRKLFRIADARGVKQ